MSNPFHLRFIVLFQLVFIFVLNVNAYSLKLQVFEKGSRIPIKDSTVFVLPQKIKMQTDEKGFVTFTDLQQSEIQVVISLSGYIRFEKQFNLVTTGDSEKIYLQKETQDSFETVITESKLKKDVSQKTMSRKEFLTLPGANGDPLKAIQNLPGINRVQGFSSAVVIQGSAPKDTAYDFEGHDIPLVFHFGGLSSVVMPEAIEQVDYYSAGYQSDYSRALGGIISLKTKKPELNEVDRKSLFYLDNLSAGGLLESRINDHSSFLISGRFSYIGFFLKNATKDNENLDLTLAPEYQDLTAFYNLKISNSDDFKLSLLSSRDKLEFIFKEPLRGDPTIRGAFSNSTQFYRLIPAYSKKINEDSKFLLSAGLGSDEIKVEVGDQYFKLKSDVVTTRFEWEYKIFQNWISQWGMDHQYSKAHVDIKLPIVRGQGGVNNPIATADKKQTEINTDILNLGFYLKNDYAYTDKLNIYPNLRLDQYSQTKETFLLPRLAAAYKYSNQWTYKMASGLYAQPPEPQESSEKFGNPDIRSPRAQHLSVGFQFTPILNFSEDSIFKLTEAEYLVSVFDRRYSSLVVSSSALKSVNGSSVFEVYNNDGEGHSMGVEATYRFKSIDYSGSINYTVSKSTRSTPTQGEYLFEYDQTHNLNFLLAKNFSNNWRLSGRYRYVTGNPYTPIISGIYDADNEVYFPKRGSVYSERLKEFQQLDMRLDKKIITNESIWTFYLDIQNILNQKNPETIQYSYDYSEKNEISGLPVLPAIGIKGEF